MKDQRSKDHIKVILAFIAVCILWGSTYLAIRIGVSDFPPALFAGLRFFTAGLLVLLFAKIKGMDFPVYFEEYKKIAVVGLLLLLGGNGLVVWAEKWVHSAMASLMVATVPLFMALLETAALKRNSLSLKGWLGLLTGFSGVALLVFSNAATEAINIPGAAMLLAGAFFWASGSVYSKSFTASGSTFSHIGIQMLAAGVALCSIGIAVGELSQVHLSPKGIGAMLYLIFFGSVIAYSCYIYVLQKWPASRAGTYAYVNPVVAILLGAVVLGESVSPSILLSAVVILGSVFIVQTSKTADLGIKTAPQKQKS
ncbi:Permease of the drug/metabolite transporter (DMT) superfamily [Geosporobacter subterraneus DSM 17957]|uniref:Permease of the drug/metabolite transporter (DMT) superfamily n=1 Tax=Geosporobacter subterraneus DSM 17957 TaxID=1121919 RepID=A0A1M6L9W2_9FIRM|nr:EamA family transporter [Geosporobacter subterraneus]SHJ67952.1 Permease of the drug/metabolite transporter (DMT) superfamily [Geosporobacter subterraneus DSM 17957]